MNYSDYNTHFQFIKIFKLDRSFRVITEDIVTVLGYIMVKV